MADHDHCKNKEELEDKLYAERNPKRDLKEE